MILDISDEEFKRIFSDKRFNLPLRWNNSNFADNLSELFDDYLKKINQCCVTFEKDCLSYYSRDTIYHICYLLVNVVKYYLDGFPAKAFGSFEQLMKLLETNPLQTYNKSIKEQLIIRGRPDKLNLYRVTCVNDNIPYDRKRLFHTPYYLRSKVSTCRYSIAGFPSLYLGTSLKLCCEEVNYNPYEQFALASRFQIERNYEYQHTEIKVIELGIKPQDFFEAENPNENPKYNNDVNEKRRVLPRNLLYNSKIRSAYLLWYPLIAACSYIRANKKDPFAAEYIVPQLLMQWIRLQFESTAPNHRQLIGIRYFSCASEKASDMGFNYVFPASGAQTYNSFCPILTNTFKLTRPYYIHEYNDIYSCEKALEKDNCLGSVYE